MTAATRRPWPAGVLMSTVSPSAMPFSSASLRFKNTGFAHVSRSHGQLSNTLWERRR